MSPRFSAAVRLRSRQEFTAVQEHGRRVAARYVTLLGQPNTLDRDRLGIIASRRLGGAVARNRAKRRLREVFRRGLSADARRPGDRTLDVVAIARRELLEAPLAALEADFQNALRRLRGVR
ncbi:MAG TPA: ribonuclease P protein component [Vicinamibacterales bacterium]|nr:ribonuclease P protein component [Vicinamibacterales bacterium]